MKITEPTTHVRLTIPAREALMAAGNDVSGRPHDGYSVRLRRPPPRLVVAMAPDLQGDYMLSLRLLDEPPYPHEGAAAWSDCGAFVPCPECGAALQWAEAGFVPGWRVCLKGHAAQLASDGRSAERHSEHDASTLASITPIGAAG